MPTTIQIRRAPAASWSAATVLSDGELGYETDTGNFKVGDGSTQWSSLAYQLPYSNGLGNRSSTATSTLAIDHQSDRVGIGTTTPSETLDVVGNAEFNGNATISGTLGVTGNTTLSGDLAVNASTSADITTTTTTATVFNTNATTLNVGGAATTISVGAATGTATINNATTAIIGNATVGGTLSVTGNSTLSGTLSVTGNTTMTGDLAVNGGDITTTATGTATVFNTNATTLNVGGAATTVALGAAAATVSIGNLSMNAGYGSIAPVYGCRGWVTWNGATTTTTCPWGGGGTATVSRPSGSNTATITTSANHNMLSGHRVYATSAIATDSYTITVTAPNQFTVTTAESTLISAGTAITLQWYTIQASGNVHSVSDDTYVGRAYLNWATGFPDANYSVHVTSTRSGSSTTPLIAGTIGSDAPTTTACPILVMEYNSNPNTGGFTSVTAFR
jgi:hypothetical protein